MRIESRVLSIECQLTFERYCSMASNEEFCITIIQLLQVWIALVSSWLIVQVNFMTFLGEKITHIYYTKPAKTYSGQTDPLILH